MRRARDGLTPRARIWPPPAARRLGLGGQLRESPFGRTFRGRLLSQKYASICWISSSRLGLTREDEAVDVAAVQTRTIVDTEAMFAGDRLEQDLGVFEFVDT